MQTPLYSPDEEMALMSRLWAPKIKDDPLSFVLYAFPWGQKGTPLENFSGPRKWQREVLSDLTAHIKANNGLLDFNTFRMAHQAGVVLASQR